MGTRSGIESIAFTKDGGFIVGGFSHKEDEEWPHYKSGGAIDSGIPLLIKYSKETADATSMANSKRKQIFKNAGFCPQAGGKAVARPYGFD